MIIFPLGEFVKYQLVITNPIFYFPKTSELPQRLKPRQVIDLYQFSTDGLKQIVIRNPKWLLMFSIPLHVEGLLYCRVIGKWFTAYLPAWST